MKLFVVVILLLLCCFLPAFSQTQIQAEDGILSKASIKSVYSGYNGSGYVSLVSKTGAYVDIVFKRSTAVTDSVMVRYANGSGSTRSLSVTINGAVAGTLSFPKTTDWNTWTTVSLPSVAMQAGINHLQFTTTGTSIYPVLDMITVGGQQSILQYKVILTKSGNGSVLASPADTYYDSGATVQFSATASGNSFFSKWFSESFSTTTNPYTTPITKHMTLAGVFLDTTGLSGFSYQPVPIGFASVNALGNNGTTGGAGGDVAIVTTTADLWNLMLGRTDANHNLNFAPLTVYVVGILGGDANTTGNTYMLDIKDASNISLIGVGNDATITGYGLAITRSINIIVRNIKFASCHNDGVALQADDNDALGHHIWVDHCTFTDTAPPGYPQSSVFDGAFDVTHTTSYVTGSWNYFTNHDKNCLFGHSDNNTSDVAMKISFHHNYFDSTGQRNPRVRFGTVHVYNNYYKNNHIYGASSNLEADVVVEGSYFLNVPIPVETSRDGSPPGDMVERNNIFVNCGPSSTRGTAFDPTTYYSYTLDSASTIPAMVAAYSGSGKYDFSNTTSTFTLTTNATNGSVAKNPDKANYDFGESVQLTATPDVNYHFVNWTGNVPVGHEGDNPLTVIVDANKTVTANFATQTFTLTLNATNGSITKSPNQGSYDSAAVIQLTAVPATGYHFVSWSGDATGSSNPTSITMDGNKSVTATFAINQYTLSITAPNGSVAKNPDLANYDYGTSVQLTATPNANYTFTSWSGDASGSSNPITIVMNGNKSVTATFGFNGVSGTQSNGTGGGAWNVASTWLNGIVPGSADTVEIVGTDSVTIPVAASCKILTVKTGGKLTASAALTVTNTFTLQSGAYYYYGASATLTLPGTPVLDNNSTVVFTGAGTGTISTTTFGNLTISRSSNTTPGGALTINGNLTLNNSAGNIVFRGTTSSTSRTNTVHGNVYINTGTLSCIDGGSGTAVATWNIDGSVFLTGSSNARLSCFTTGATAAVVGTYNIGGNLNINGGRLAYASNSSTTGIGVVNLRGNLTVDTLSSITDNGSNGPFSLNFTGFGIQTVTLGMNFAMTTTTTLNDTIKAGSNVVFNFGRNSWRIPSSGAFVVNGTLELKDSSKIIGPGAFVLNADSRLKLGSPFGIVTTDTIGNIQTTGSRVFNANALYEYDGSVRQLTGNALPATVAELTINNAAGVTLSQGTTVATTLKLQSGVLSTDLNTLEVATTGNVSRTSGHVNGKLKKTMFAGESSKIFEIGDANAYTPVDVAGVNYASAWVLTVSTVPTEHPDVANSGLDSANSLNRYYILTGTPTGLSDVTFNFVPGDVDAGADTNRFFVKKYDAPTWSSISVGTRSSTSVQAIDISSFSEFAIGQLTGPVHYTLATNVTGNGSVTKSPDQSFYDSLQQVTLTAIPAVGWHFTGWTGDSVTTNNPIIVTMNANKSFTATFAINTYSLSVSTTGSGSVTKNPDHTSYDSGAVVVVTATPSAIWKFNTWTGDLTGSQNPDTIIMTGNKSITANFVLDTTARSVGVNAGWNLVSLPLTVSDPRKVIVFPSAISNAFAYSGSYTQKDSLQNDIGYWLKFGAQASIPVTGIQRICDTIDVKAGWNLIGSISDTVSVNAITVLPPQITLSPFYGYKNGYLEVFSLYPGGAYWVRASMDGQLILNSSLFETKTVISKEAIRRD